MNEDVRTNNKNFASSRIGSSDICQVDSIISCVAPLGFSVCELGGHVVGIKSDPLVGKYVLAIDAPVWFGFGRGGVGHGDRERLTCDYCHISNAKITCNPWCRCKVK